MGLVLCARLWAVYEVRGETLPRVQIQEKLTEMQTKLEAWKKTRAALCKKLLDGASGGVDEATRNGLVKEIAGRTKLIKSLEMTITHAIMSEQALKTSAMMAANLSYIESSARQIELHAPQSAKAADSIANANDKITDRLQDAQDQMDAMMQPSLPSDDTDLSVKELMDVELAGLLGVDCKSDVMGELKRFALMHMNEEKKEDEHKAEPPPSAQSQLITANAAQSEAKTPPPPPVHEAQVLLPNTPVLEDAEDRERLQERVNRTDSVYGYEEEDREEEDPEEEHEDEEQEYYEEDDEPHVMYN